MPDYPKPEDMYPRLTSIEQRITELLSTTPDEILHRRPRSGGWSIAEVLEHLVISNGSYNAEIGAALSRADLPWGDPSQWTTGLAGGMVLRSLTATRRFPAPPAWKVRSAPREQVGEAFLRTVRELRDHIARASGLDWNAIAIRSPALRLLRIRLGEAFAIGVIHAERHLRQIDRVRDEVTRTPAATGG